MEFVLEDLNRGLDFVRNTNIRKEWLELESAIQEISDKEIISSFEERIRKGKKTKSISDDLNTIIKSKLVDKDWFSESSIFKGEGYQKNMWRLDFAKKSISVEVSFNHGEATAWNLLKPTLAGRKNHVTKAIQTEIAVVILATESLKKVGGFDGSIITLEKARFFLEAMGDILTTPLILIGLQPPRTFRIEHKDIGINGKKFIGKVIKNYF